MCSFTGVYESENCCHQVFDDLYILKESFANVLRGGVLMYYFNIIHIQCRKMYTTDRKSVV